MKKKLILTLLLLTVTTTIGITLYKYKNNENNSVVIESNVDTSTENKVIEEDYKKVDNTYIENNINTMKNEVLNYLGDEADSVGIVYYDINNNMGFEINKDTDFRSASTAKLFTVMCLYDYVHKNIIDINEEMYYSPNDYEGGTGIMQYMNLNRGFTLKELADYSIKNSDNIAFNMILRRIGFREVLNYYEDIIGHEIGSPITMSASDGAKLLLKVYENNDNNPYYEDLINNLKDTEFKNRIEQYLPIYSVAHKIGSYDSYIHDIGIVYTDRPYILTIFTNGIANAEDKIANISKIIYELNEKES